VCGPFVPAVAVGERDAAFSALGEMAGSLAAVGCQEGFEGYLGAIAAQVRGRYTLLQPYCTVQYGLVHCFTYGTLHHRQGQYIKAQLEGYLGPIAAQVRLYITDNTLQCSTSKYSTVHRGAFRNT
jgi:hypothetical protein